jgi:hypothetical protein
VGDVDGLRLGRAALAEVDAEDDEAADRQELRLPILQRFEPELGSEQVAEGGHAAFPVGHLLGAVGVGAGDEMAAEGDGEQGEQHDAEGVLVEPEHPATPSDRPRCPGVVAVFARVRVQRGVAADGLGLGRAPLHQPGGEEHVDAHLEELGLPVLERGLAERGPGQVLGEAHRGLAMGDLLLVVCAVARPRLAPEPDHEERPDGDDGQAVVTDEPAHACHRAP